MARAALGGVALMAVAACGNTTVQEQLGLGRRAPDEFQVVRRAPLIIPPDYSLRPPEPGAPGPQEQDPSTSAEALLTGQAPARPVGTQSTGEAALLASSPVAPEPGIRERIVQENIELADLDDRSFLLILNFQRRQFQPQESVIDPVAEAARLRSEGRIGSVVTVRTGSQPIVE